MPTLMSDEIYTTEEISTYLKLPKQTVYKLTREGKIPAIKVGKYWRFKKQALDRWFQKNMFAPKAGHKGRKEAR